MASVTMGVVGRAALGTVFAASLVATTAGTAHAAPGMSSAYGAKASLGPIKLPEVIKSRFTAGPSSDTLAQLTVPTVGTVRAVETTATGNATYGTTRSSAKTAAVRLNLRLAAVSADAIGATCSAKPGSLPVGRTLIVNGAAKTPIGAGNVRFPANPAPNTRLTLPAGLGSVTLNEQIRKPDGSLTVNAVHVKVAPASPLKGDIVLASATCKPGKAEKKGAITPYAVDTYGDRVGGVAFELKKYPERALAPSCTGNSMGYCTFPNLSAGKYAVCATDVPDGYKMPKPRCRGDIVVDGNHRYVRFVIPEEEGKGKQD
ncbi:choice-of-anchor P family protein [Streptomyces luteolus]|uniref:Choice-of-anchor P family protein n=1 Tax=Streptomyces luteolus TaxID=3043615 RepID=A0ABT6T6G2_9ACTN|nr:choice-of-anchor P family protein [Streptomyces sp. B-S-A12]MDI3423478.1 choice-of-anchor P family protein [Streptomyces sp. B-S-A12]